MFEITGTTSSPYSSICYIRCDWPDGSATRASAVVVGVNDVLTALHAVFDDSRGGWARDIIIYPGADTSPFLTQPFGAFSDVGSIVGRAANWDLDGDGLLTQAESAGDLALLGLTSRIGDVTGWLPVADPSTSFAGMMVGYPARGTGMMGESVYADATPDGVYDIDSGLGAGASGGPLLYQNGGVTAVAGVLSSGDVYNTISTYAGLYSTGTWDWLLNAMAQNDALIGLPPGSAPLTSPNVFMGTSASDSLTGTSGHDVFTGNAGDDTLDGAGGVDTATFAGNRASYTITHPNPDAMIVVDAVRSRDGTDTLWHIERLHFADISLAFDTSGTAGEAYRLYQAAFDRVPDQAGLGFQMNALETGLTLEQVAGNFIASPEFQTRYGSAVTNAQFVTLLYENVLHREPEQAGLDYHLNELASGQTRAEVLVHFSESPEDEANLIGVMSQGMAYIPA
jgi:V8-like Glu-specific endopeptidase